MQSSLCTCILTETMCVDHLSRKMCILIKLIAVETSTTYQLYCSRMNGFYVSGSLDFMIHFVTICAIAVEINQWLNDFILNTISTLLTHIYKY